MPLPQVQPERPVLSSLLQQALDKRAPAQLTNNSESQSSSRLSISVPATVEQPRQPSSKSPSAASSSTSRMRLKLQDYLSPVAAGTATQKLGAIALSNPQNAVSNIKLRKNARKFFTVLEHNWVPNLNRIKADAFEEIKTVFEPAVTTIQNT